jgi:3-hydroxyacyl-[acyl-carrier-protein] dehydratase
MRFLLVDRIHSLEPGLRVVASRKIAPDEDYFADHFPGFPVVPGVLLTEMMGQAAAKALDSERRARGKAMLAKIASASFRQWVRPGDEVMLHGEITTNTDRYANADCRAEVNGKPVAQASLFFTFIPANAFMGDLRDAVLEEFLAKSAT